MKWFKQWWNGLLIRERQLWSAGGGIAAVLFFYVLIWTPFIDKIASLHEQVIENKQLVEWPVSSKTQIITLRKIAKKVVSSNVQESLLTKINASLTKQQLIGSVTNLKQQDNGTIQLSFKAVSFDDLVRWLAKENNIQVAEARITSTDVSGLVQADLVLGNS